jgi:hypothetical protein
MKTFTLPKQGINFHRESPDIRIYSNAPLHLGTTISFVRQKVSTRKITIMIVYINVFLYFLEKEVEGWKNSYKI